MSVPSVTEAERIQPLRLMHPYLLADSVNIEGAMIATGISEEEARLIEPGSERIYMWQLQDYILARNREAQITVHGTLIWLSVRGIEIPDTPGWKTDSVRELLRRALRLVDPYGNTTAHYICGDAQYLKFLGPDFFTPETLLIENEPYKDSAADWAAKHDNLHLLPKSLLTEAVVLHEDVVRWTLLEHAMQGWCLSDIPERFFTPKNLFESNAEPLDNSEVAPWAHPRSKKFNEIPWERLSARKWIKALHRLYERRKQYPSPGLDNLINRAEAMKQLIENRRADATEQ